MLIEALSLNVDGLTRSPGLPRQPQGELYVEMTQEDARAPNTPPLTAAAALAGYKELARVSLNRTTSNQNVLLLIYGKKAPITVRTGSIPFERKAGVKGKLEKGFQALGSLISYAPGYSKGATWALLDYGPAGGTYMFVNLHLPIKTSDKDTYGLAYRTQVLKEALKQAYWAIDMEDIKTATVLVGGDLNFRMTREGVNQFTTLLGQQNLPLALQELEHPPGQGGAFTCKFRKGTDRACRLRRVAAAPGPDHAAVSNAMIGPGGCMDPERTPSRCDRFAIWTAQPYTTLKYDTEVLLDSSDHNAIVALVDVGQKSGLNAPAVDEEPQTFLPTPGSSLAQNMNNPSTPTGGRRGRRRATRHRRATLRRRRQTHRRQ